MGHEGGFADGGVGSNAVVGVDPRQFEPLSGNQGITLPASE